MDMLVVLFALVTVHVVHALEECTEQTKLKYIPTTVSKPWYEYIEIFQRQNINYYINLLCKIMYI